MATLTKEFNLNDIQLKIRQKKTITDKLNYWRGIVFKYIDEPAEKIQTESQDIFETARYKDKIVTQLFNDVFDLPFFPIPQSIYNEHFKSAINEPELTYWFLNYYAKMFSERRKEVLKAGGGLHSVIPIKKEILRIEELEKNAKEWFLDPKRKINLSTTPPTQPEREKIEIIRVLDKEYYKNYPVSDIHASGGNITIEVYAEHIYLKDFLETKLKKLEAIATKEPTTPKMFSNQTHHDEKENLLPHVPDAISFKEENYQTQIDSWNKKNNNNLIKWIQDGSLIEIEKWHFVKKEILQYQYNELESLYGLIDLNIIMLNDLQDELAFICHNKAESIRNIIYKFFPNEADHLIRLPFYLLCPPIIDQPIYLLEALEKYPKELPEQQRTYYSYKYIFRNKLEVGKDKFQLYRKGLINNVIIEISNGNKSLVNRVFLFMEHFIDELSGLHGTKFKYFESPLFKILFSVIIQLKDYYITTFDQFTFKNILIIEKLLEEVNTPAKVLSVTYLPYSTPYFPKSYRFKENLCFDNPDTKIKLSKISDCKCELELYGNEHDTKVLLLTGFCIYFIWNKQVSEIGKLEFGTYDTWDERFFKNYFDVTFKEYQLGIPPNENIDKNKYITRQIQNEKNHLDRYINLPNFSPPFNFDSTIEWTNDFIKWMENLLSQPFGIRTDKTGFKSKLIEKQIEKIWNLLIANEFIDEDTLLKNFKAIFSKKKLPADFVAVKWIHLNKRKKPNQTSLREFLKVCMVFETMQPDQETTDTCISDINGGKIVFSGFKKDHYTEHYRKKFSNYLN